MNIAIPVYGKWVMPRFGYTREMIIVTVEDDKIASIKRLKMTPERFESLGGQHGSAPGRIPSGDFT